MQQSDLLWLNVVAFVPLSIVGALLHFAYDWSRHNRVVAVFAAVNESYWEHIKIALWPVLLWFIALFAAGGWRLPGFVPAATIALYTIPVTMVAVVLLYKSVAKRNILWIDIAAFFITVAVSLLAFTLMARELAATGWTIALSTAFLILLCAALFRFTLQPPAEPDLFVDPLNERYGLDAHPDS